MNLMITPINPYGRRYSETIKKNGEAHKAEVYSTPSMSSLAAYRPSFGFAPIKDPTAIKEEPLNLNYFLLPPGAAPDEYQLEAAKSLNRGDNTMVTAPTGTGKTAIAYYIITKNFNKGKKTFYTTPLKALSNQKYGDLKKQFGEDNVGILTGDRKENLRAPILVMTTEIYRNIVLSNFLSNKADLLENLKTVVFDEFHYMGDLSRGKIWEESVIFTPDNVQMLGLSATVNNAKNIKYWISSIKEKNAALVEVPTEKRHVPLVFHTWAPEHKDLSRIEGRIIHPKCFIDALNKGELTEVEEEALATIARAMGYKEEIHGQKKAINTIMRDFKYIKGTGSLANVYLEEKELVKYLVEKDKIDKKTIQTAVSTLAQSSRSNPYRENILFDAKRIIPENIADMVKILNRQTKLPAIFFVFSKKFSRNLLEHMLEAKINLNTEKEADEIREIVKKYKNEKGFFSTTLNERALWSGFAVHSAGILPLEKELIEELFIKKLVKVVFATETLAAGINMPAKTVVLTNYKKACGDDQERILTANEFHQMSGRAGRRGIDTIGNVVMMTPSITAKSEFLNLVSSPPDDIKSQYRIDASLVAGFYEHYSNEKVMKEIIERTFSIHDAPSDEKEIRIKEQMQTFQKIRELLVEKGLIDHTGKLYQTNTKGEIVSLLKGVEQIPITEALINKKFEVLTPTELAGVVAAIAVETHADCSTIKLLPETHGSMKRDAEIYYSKLSEIQGQIKNSVAFIQRNYSINKTSEDILALVDALPKEKILSKEAFLSTEVKKISNDLNRLYASKSKFVRVTNTKTQNILANIKFEIDTKKSLQRNYRIQLNMYLQLNRLKTLIEEREKLENTNPQFAKNEPNRKFIFGKNSTYNELAAIYTDYNKKIETLKIKLPQAKLNSNAMNFVFKWAKLNESSNDYIRNWQALCRELNNSSEIRFEGDLYNAISQTIDFLHQLVEASSIALKSKDLRQDFDYYNKLRENAKEAVELLRRPPVYSLEQIPESQR